MQKKLDDRDALDGSLQCPHRDAVLASGRVD